ncbi:MAG: NAD(P)-dependent alcohol dehydrogenase [Leptospirales bacterium]
MKAIVYTEYGGPEVLKLEEVEQPVPKDNEVLIKVHATPVNYGDMLARNFGNITSSQFNMPLFLLPMVRLVFGVWKPKINILGSELAGQVKAVGKDVKNFKEGDLVFAYPEAKFGANAEYICMKADGLVALKPGNMTFEEACTVPYGALTALNVLRKLDSKNIEWENSKILINGASGSIGSYALQLAKSFGAEVTGVCSTARLDYIKSLGADYVVDYTKEDFTSNGQTYDIILDVLGKSSFSACNKSLKKNGIYLLASFKTKPIFQMLRTKFFGSKKVICAMSSYKQEDLVYIKELVEQGKIKTVIDKCFTLEQTAEAHAYAEAGKKKGHVVITVTD